MSKMEQTNKKTPRNVTELRRSSQNAYGNVLVITKKHDPKEKIRTAAKFLSYIKKNRRSLL
jgi:hypothetical protein